jgi:hypothetical protein
MPDPFEDEAREICDELAVEWMYEPGKLALVAQAIRRERNRTVEECASIIDNAARELERTMPDGGKPLRLLAVQLRKLKVNDGE